MGTGIYVKEEGMQLWGTSNNPGSWEGTALNLRCCPCYCMTFVDTFDRADSTDLGDDWYECAGDWEIKSGHLWIGTDTSDPYVTCKHMASDMQVGNFTARVTISAYGWNSVGCVYRIHAFVGTSYDPPTYCGGVSDSYVLELKYIGYDPSVSLYHPYGSLSLRKGSTTYGERTVIFRSSRTEFGICVGNGEIQGWCEHASGTPIWMCPESVDNYWFALGTDGEVEAYFDEVLYIDHADHDASCPECENACCCPCIEQETNRPPLTATIVGECNGTMTGATGTLECGGIAGECCIWSMPYGNVEFTCLDGYDMYNLRFIMRCLHPRGGCDSYSMTIIWPPSIQGGSNLSFCYEPDENVTKGIVGECSCNPLSLTFGPFRLWRDPGQLMQYVCHCCEEFYVVVTE